MLGVRLDIEIYAGMTWSTTIALQKDGIDLPLVNGDKIIFTLKADIDDAVALIEKEIASFTDGKADIELAPADTDIEPDTYKYNIVVVFADGEKQPIVGNSNFKIKQGVYNG